MYQVQGLRFDRLCHHMGGVWIALCNSSGGKTVPHVWRSGMESRCIVYSSVYKALSPS